MKSLFLPQLSESELLADLLGGYFSGWSFVSSLYPVFTAHLLSELALYAFLATDSLPFTLKMLAV